MSRSYQATQSVFIACSGYGLDAEIEMTVYFTVDPGRAQTRTLPAERETVDVKRITFSNDKGIIKIDPYFEEIITDNDGFDEWLLQEAAECEEARAHDYADHKLKTMKEAM